MNLDIRILDSTISNSPQWLTKQCIAKKQNKASNIAA